MNILKEKIKLYVSYPKWPMMMKKMKKSSNKKILLFGTPMHGNLGDHAIATQARYFFEDFFSEYEYYEILMPMYHTQKEKIKNLVNSEDLIVISGGGWMGNLWIHNEIVIREIIESYPNNKIVILPQTVYYSNDELGNKELKITNKIMKKHKDLHIFLREKRSYNFVNENFKLMGKSNFYLVPDMVLYGKNINIETNDIKDKEIINVCIREDCESQQKNINEFYEKLQKEYNIRLVSTVIKSPVLLKNRMIELKKSWICFKEAKITITDRLHAMLFSVLNGTPCIVLDNKTGKVFGVADWLEDSGMIIKVNSLDEVYDILKTTDFSKFGKKYDREKLLFHFEKMAEIIRKD